MYQARLGRHALMSASMALAVAVLSAGSHFVAAQSQDDATRRLWDTAFIKSGKQGKQKRAGARRYRVATPNIPVTGVAGDSVVGVTVWRLRRPNSSDSGERLLVQEGTEQEEWIPERISANTRLSPGDRLRVSVEAARTGYLYVIDREQYADGSFSEPYLIFPTTRTLNGDNKVNAGKLIEIPSQDDGPPYFTLKRSRPDQIAEVLSMLITPEPLTNLEITDKAQKLAATQVEAWEKQWSIQVGSVELEGGAGKAWTKEEKEAGGNPNVVLRNHAPAPQILYYRDGVRAAEPMLLKVQLRYRPAIKRPASKPLGSVQER